MGRKSEWAGRADHAENLVAARSAANETFKPVRVVMGLEAADTTGNGSSLEAQSVGFKRGTKLGNRGLCSIVESREIFVREFGPLVVQTELDERFDRLELRKRLERACHENLHPSLRSGGGDLQGISQED